MELYRKYPVHITIWALVENFLFVGVIFGWSSLVVILKEEGFYLEYCKQRANYNQSDSVLQNSTSVIQESQNSRGNTTMFSDSNNSDEAISVGCPAQETKLNLWYSIAASALYLSYLAVSPFQRKYGTRITRVIFSSIYLMGTLCMAFATPELPWLLLPGLTGIGIGGMTIHGTNTQVYICLSIGPEEGEVESNFRTKDDTSSSSTERNSLPTRAAIFPSSGMDNHPAGFHKELRSVDDEERCLHVIGARDGHIMAELYYVNMTVGLLSEVSYLHPRLQSTIVALFVGLFDFSSFNKQLIRIAYENGTSRKTSYLFMSGLFAVITSISTLFFLPKMSIGDHFLEQMEKRRKQSVIQVKQTSTHAKQKENEVVEDSVLEVSKEAPKPSLCSIVFSVTCILHIYWTFVHAVRFVTFIGQLNVWLDIIFNKDETRVGGMIDVFSYITIASIGTALLPGFVYDYQRKRYKSCGKIKGVYLPAVLPMCLVIFFSVGTTVFCYIKNDVTPYFSFVLFTFFRTSLYSVAVAFMGNAFPADYFSNLMGLVLFSAGIGGLVQYPLFQWFEAYIGAYIHVNSFLLVLQVSTIIHPALLYIKGRRDKTEVDSSTNRFEYEIKVTVPAT